MRRVPVTGSARATRAKRAKRDARGTLVALAFLGLSACREAVPPSPPSPTASSPSPTSPAAKPSPAIRYAIGGDSREDTAHVLPWAFREARTRGVAALIFLGDMESRPELDDHFRGELAELGSVPFLPVLGNHESVRREHAVDATREERTRAIQTFRARFLGKQASAGGAPSPPTHVDSAFDDKLAYALDLPGGVHFVALDNVSQSGFGADQLAWLAKDLRRARGAGAKHLLVGMHKALAGSGVTTHAMDEDGPAALADSAAALALFEETRVELVVASHFHGLAEYSQHGIRSFITGGLGAPLDVSHGKEPSFHHFLVASVPPDAPLTVEVIRFPGAPATEQQHER